MFFEALAARHGNIDESLVIPLGLSQDNGIYHADWSALIPVLTDKSLPQSERAARFHLSMAHSLLQQAIRLREDTGVKTIGLAGGVFQNRWLTEKCLGLLKENDFDASLPLLMPVNDASISFGQIIEHGYKRR